MALTDETAKEVLVEEKRPPILYDAKYRPLVRSVGFRGVERDSESE